MKDIIANRSACLVARGHKNRDWHDLKNPGRIGDIASRVWGVWRIMRGGCEVVII